MSSQVPLPSVTQRLQGLVSHLATGNVKGRAAIEAKSPDDVVITMAIRSPMCKARKGGFKDTTSEELLVEMYRQSIARSNIDPGLIQDITVGTVLSPGALYEARAAALTAGIPDHVPIQVINRFCSSGLMAVTDISNKIKCGQIDIGLAIGLESMSQHPDDGWKPKSEVLANSQLAQDCAMPMGWTSENVAVDFQVTREEMDALAAESFQRAEKAEKAGWFQNEIVPFTAYVKDPTTGQRTTKVITKDDGIRYGTTKEALLKVRPAFPQWGRGQTTGGNASQITDGVAAVLLMKRSKAEALGLKVIAKHVTTAVTGVAPRIMGIGPRYAIPLVLAQTGLTKEDIDLFEINEAFASMYVYCIRELELDSSKVNVNGGAIALGHPLGCTGARQVATGLNELTRRNGKILLTSMCIGTGMGAAAVFVRD